MEFDLADLPRRTLVMSAAAAKPMATTIWRKMEKYSLMGKRMD